MRFLICILFLVLMGPSFAQTQEKDLAPPKSEIFTMVAQMPQFPDGNAAMTKYLNDNIIYPKTCRDLHVGGKAFLKFTVTKEGKIENVHVLKGTGFPVMDEEAVRLVQSMPDWQPGKQNGRAVDVFFNLPVDFALPTPYYIFNTLNTLPNYIETKALIQAGGKEKEILKLLLNGSANNTNLDVMYNIAVAYYLLKDNKKACSYFKNIQNTSTDKILVVNNAKEFLQKYCSN